MAAAVYAASDGLGTLLIEGRQAKKFGTELVMLRGVVGSSMRAGGRPTLTLEGRCEGSADVTVVAPGMAWRRLEADGVDDLPA